MTKNNKNTKDNSILYLSVLGLIIIIALVLIFSKQCSNTGGSNNNTMENTPATGLSVDSESGNPDETIAAEINIPERKIDFSKSMQDIMDYEAKRDDTLKLKDNYKPAESADEYVYLEYSFNDEHAPKIFDKRVDAFGDVAKLTYIFHKDDLTEVRINYGDIGRSAFDDIAASISSLYGNATYSQYYSDDSLKSQWKNKDVTLELFANGDNMTIVYKKNK